MIDHCHIFVKVDLSFIDLYMVPSVPSFSDGESDWCYDKVFDMRAPIAIACVVETLKATGVNAHANYAYKFILDFGVMAKDVEVSHKPHCKGHYKKLDGIIDCA